MAITHETKLSKTDVIVLAAICARANMGQPLPSTADVARLRQRGDKITLSSAVMAMCQEYMETDEHQRMFEDEARGWTKNLGKKTVEGVRKAWPDIGVLYFGLTDDDGETR